MHSYWLQHAATNDLEVEYWRYLWSSFEAGHSTTQALPMVEWKEGSRQNMPLEEAKAFKLDWIRSQEGLAAAGMLAAVA